MRIWITVLVATGCGRFGFGDLGDAHGVADVGCDPLSFGVLRDVTEIDTAGFESGPATSGDDLEIYFHTPRTGGQGLDDIWGATRASTSVAFGAPVPIVELCSVSNEGAPTLTGDALSSENRPELLMPFYVFVLLLFFAYCYPIARWTVAMEKKYAVNI